MYESLFYQQQLQRERVAADRELADAQRAQLTALSAALAFR